MRAPWPDGSIVTIPFPTKSDGAVVFRKAPLPVSNGTLTDACPITPGERWTFAFAPRG